MQFHSISEPKFLAEITHFLSNFFEEILTHVTSLSIMPMFLLSVFFISTHSALFIRVISSKTTHFEHTTSQSVSPQYYLEILYLAILLKTCCLFQNLSYPSDRSAILW